MQTHFTSAAYRELGRLLRQTRKTFGLSSHRLARKMGWPLTTISRMENGWRRSSTTDVIQYAVMCGLKSSPELDRLVEFTKIAESELGYYLSDELIGGSLQSLIFYETSAERLISYEPQVVHGLLQTPRYAHALVSAINCDAGEDWVAGVVSTRMERRRIILQPNCAQFTFYLHEHALRLRVGSDEIMHEQLLHLVLTAALDNVELRIVPSTAGERSAVGGAFRLLEFDRHPAIVYLDDLGGSGLILDDKNHVGRYRKLLPALAGVALSEGQSREFAADLADEYDRGSQRRGADGLAQKQLQRWRGVGLHGGLMEPPSPIYE